MMTVLPTNPLESWVIDFNDRQREAFEHDGHCAVLAGPGSGKTKILVARVARLLSQRAIGPRGIACVTFSNEAVREIRLRLAQLGNTQSRRLFIGTVHSFCLSCVVAPFGHLFRTDLPAQLRIASTSEQREALELAITETSAGGTADSWQTPLQEYRRTHPFRDQDHWNEDPRFTKLILAMESVLHRKGLLDFDDIILIALDLIAKHSFVRDALEARFPFLVVDEYQDLGFPLHEMVRLLMESTSTEVFAVGDPDQSIYGFAGASPIYLREMAQLSDVHSVDLTVNYRCAQQIIDGSQVVLAPEKPRGYTSARQGVSGDLLLIECPRGIGQQAAVIATQILPTLNASGVPNGEIAILCIDRLDAGEVRGALENAGVKFAGERDDRYPRTPVSRWLEDVAAWCCAYPANQDTYSLGEILARWESMKMEAEIGIEPERLKDRSHFFDCLTQLALPEMDLSLWLTKLDDLIGVRSCLARRVSFPEDVQLWDLLIERSQTEGPMGTHSVGEFARFGGASDTVILTTLHGSKGLEYRAVIMLGLEEGRLPRFNDTSVAAIAEKRRVFYVGMTRAKDVVYMLFSGWNENRYGRRFANGPSRFVLELQSRLQISPTTTG